MTWLLHFSKQNQMALFLFVASVGVATIIHATPSSPNLACPAGQKLFGTRCYGAYRPSAKCRQDFNQSAANDLCEAYGGELASIHSQAEQNFITGLIKSGQRSQAKKLAAKAKCGGCRVAQKDYFYWIGLELSHSANGSVNGASWTDGSSVNYGNPTSASFRPPFVTGRPTGSSGDGSEPTEVCPLGNENKCVQVYGFGKTTVGKWTDKHCDDQHTQNVTCGCTAGESNSTSVVEESRRRHQSSYSSASAEEDQEDEIDECRDEAALNGVVCERCPVGWTPFQGHCYLPISGQTADGYHATCSGFGGNVSSIHSAAENHFVSDLAAAAFPGSQSNLIGLTMTRPNNAQNAPVTSAAWSDGTTVDYGNPVVAPWNARGVYPWGTGSVPGNDFPQPDNVPPPGTCAFMWQPGNPFQLPSEWEDVPCTGLAPSTAVCKI